MQTFLPYENIRWSMQALDQQRLGKQRAETKQLLMSLIGMDDNKARRNHPACRMWEGYEWWLCHYGMLCATEWTLRGFRDTTWLWFWACQRDLESANPRVNREKPWWMGLPEFHSSHRSNLIRKKPEHYLRLGWVETDNVEYVWPNPHVEGEFTYGLPKRKDSVR